MRAMDVHCSKDKREKKQEIRNRQSRIKRRESRIGQSDTLWSLKSGLNNIHFSFQLNTKFIFYTLQNFFEKVRISPLLLHCHNSLKPKPVLNGNLRHPYDNPSIRIVLLTILQQVLFYYLQRGNQQFLEILFLIFESEFSISGFLKKLPALPITFGSGSLLLRILITACEIACIEILLHPFFPIPVPLLRKMYERRLLSQTKSNIQYYKLIFIFSFKHAFPITKFAIINTERYNFFVM